MAETKMTRSQALAIALEFVEDEQALEVLAHMKEQLDKPKGKTTTKSKTRLDNEATARSLYAVAGDEPFGSQYVMEHTTAITPQKVVGIMKVGVELGLFEKFKDGKATLYRKVQ